MFNSETLEVAIGMAFLFLAVSLICTAAKEWLEGIFKWRAMDLERGLRTLLDDADGSIASQLLRHPMLNSLFAGQYDPAQLRSSWLTPGKNSLHMRLSQRRHLPSYIPAEQFAVALLDCVARGPMAASRPASLPASVPADDLDAATLHPGPLSVDVLRHSALALASPHLQRAVLTALDHSDGDLAQARANIETWFNGTMDRASGWYKRRSQAVLFMLGFAVSAALNVDALHVMQRLTADKSFREAVVKEAANTVAAGPDASASAAQQARIDNARAALEKVAMPIGWRAWTRGASTDPASAPAEGEAASPAAAASLARPRTLPVPTQLCKPLATDPTGACQRTRWLDSDWLPVLFGWLATAFAVMLGAPFWFDVLNRIMVIRSTVKPHEKSPEESSEDRQTPPSR